MPEIFMIARRGEVITCSNGHPTYQSLMNIYSSNAISHCQFNSISSLPDPEYGARIVPCPCGADSLGSLRLRLDRFYGPNGQTLYRAYLAQVEENK